MKNTLRSPYFLTLFASLGLALAPMGCSDKEPGNDSDDTETSGDGDGDTGDGDGDTGDGDGDTGDGDGDSGDGDGDSGDGDGDGECMPGNGGGANGASCTTNQECDSCNCYVVPFVGGQCGECDNNEGDMDCAEVTGGGCTPPNPFENNGSTCNMGELGGGCQSSEVCEDGLTCGIVLDLLSVIKISTCGECASDSDCGDDQICAPDVVVEEFSGINKCITPGDMANDKFCKLDGNGDQACATGICSTVSIMNIAEIGACGECNTDADCEQGQTCKPGGFDLGGGTLTGSKCE